MKTLLLAILAFSSTPLLADAYQHKNHKTKEEKRETLHPVALSAFDVIPLNSPVKESVAKFLLKVPKGFDIDEVRYKIKNSSRRLEKDKSHQKINLINGFQGKELHVSVSKLPPGFYQLFVRVIDRKRREYNYKTKFKDYAMFVIDSSLEVKMPDPKINNATLLGVDSDNDGIRDDVQRWINEEFINKSLDLKLAYKQYAIDFQSSMQTSNDKAASILASHATIKSQICLYEMGDLLGIPDKEQESTRQKIKLMYLNTRERIEAELKADKNFHGQSGTMLSREEACNF